MKRSSSATGFFVAGILLWSGLLLAYFQVGAFQSLTYDDPSFLQFHPAAELSLTSLDFWGTIFRASTNNLWHPVTDLSHQVLFRLSPEPALHLWVNAFLHGLNALVLFWILQRVTGERLFSFGFACLFAWHPVTVESVAWISGRKDLLSSLFLLLAVAVYLWKGTWEVWQTKGVIFLLGVLACLSKPSGFLLPFLLLAIDYWPLGRVKLGWKVIWEKWPLWILSLVSVVITILGQARGTQAVDDTRSLPIRLIEALWALEKSAQVIAFPKGLHFVYANPERLSPLWLGLSLGALGLLVALLWWQRKRLPSVGAGLFWFGVALAPTVGLIRAGNQLTADRYSYLPLVGVLLVLAGLPVRKWSGRGKLAGVSVLFAIAVLFLSLSAGQVSQWRSQEALFSEVLQHEPQNEIARVELAILAFREGKEKTVRDLLEPVLRRIPENPGARALLGNLSFDQGNYAVAYDHYEVAAKTWQQDAFLQERLAASAHGMGNLEQTREHLKLAFQLARVRDRALDLEKKWRALFPGEPFP